MESGVGRPRSPAGVPPALPRFPGSRRRSARRRTTPSGHRRWRAGPPVSTKCTCPC